jgi:hypothetical protein
MQKALAQHYTAPLRFRCRGDRRRSLRADAGLLSGCAHGAGGEASLTTDVRNFQSAAMRGMQTARAAFRRTGTCCWERNGQVPTHLASRFGSCLTTQIISYAAHPLDARTNGLLRPSPVVSDSSQTGCVVVS